MDRGLYHQSSRSLSTAILHDGRRYAIPVREEVASAATAGVRRCRPAVRTALCALLLFSSAAPRIAASTPSRPRTAAQLLNHLAIALGGLANVKKIHSLYFEFQGEELTAGPPGDTFRMKIPIEGSEWLTAQGDDRIEQRSASPVAPSMLTVMEGGASPKGWVLVGDQGWPSGNSSGQMQGPDLSQAISRVYWNTFAYLTGSGVTATFANTSTTNGPDYTLKIAPAGGATIMVSIDSTTFLPLNVRIGDDPDNLRVLVPSHWKVVDGVLFPLELHFRDTSGQLDITYTYTKIEVNASPPKGAFAQPTPSV